MWAECCAQYNEGGVLYSFSCTSSSTVILCITIVKRWFYLLYLANTFIQSSDVQVEDTSKYHSGSVNSEILQNKSPEKTCPKKKHVRNC